MELGLKDRVAIVTGASKGLGKAIALELAREGCKAVLCARGEDELEETAGEVREFGKALAVVADVTRPEDVENIVGETVDHFGNVDILVNNAGGVGNPAAFEELSDEEWMEVLDLNLLSAVRLSRAVLPHMREQRWGSHYQNVASESGVQPDPFMPHYNASKAALINLTKSLAKTYGQEGILVNAVSPAFVMTPLVEDMLAEAAQESGGSIEDAEAAFLEESRPHIVVGRSGAAEETAAVVAFLASERASFVTGSNYRVDGGSVASIP
jgi:3-oxoacyl-[acyl-carrier protein] reductase